MTRVALLWHMHQPFYEDLVTGEHILPWVRLHAIKDYWGMVALLREFPSMKVTFNLVPSLLVQLEAFARNDAKDRHLELGLKPADELTDEERAFCVEEFFHAQRARMIEPHPRYAELFARRGEERSIDGRRRTERFTTDDIRDLQVWHKLVWIDPIYFDRDRRVQALVQKGRRFTEEDKLTLRSVELELLANVVPGYREAAMRGQVELSTSPFYHPILPLLCDTDIYTRAHTERPSVRERFRHPEDAAEQLARAVALHERLFGAKPRGLWPSEGSVSDEMVGLVVAAGFTWMATDEQILARTLGRGFARDADGGIDHPEVLYRPYRVAPPGGSIACGFRDHALSDQIGFFYASWPAAAAADDFVRRLVEAGRRFTIRTGGAEATVFVILDGENAWEHYEGQGRPFLRALYERLSTHAELRPVTMSEACDGAADTLPSIHPGSWIDADFYIWIGHRDDHRAWGQLVDARRELANARPTMPADSLARAWEEMLIAEGSDWFWWYGDDHSSDHDLEFDQLFRRHVQNVYRALGRPIPDDLFVTNITTEPPTLDIQRPTALISPTFDGAVSSYFEWLGAGSVAIRPVSGAMHQVTEGSYDITRIAFGFDLDHLFVRVDANEAMTRVMESGIDVEIAFVRPSGFRVVLRSESRQGTAWTSAPCDGFRAAVGAIAEVRVPFECLGATPGDVVSFLVALTREGADLVRHPSHRPIEVVVPGPDFPSLNWTA